MALKFISAEEAAFLVKNNDNVGFSGFTHAGCPKVVPVEIAKRAEAEHAKGNPFKIGIFTGGHQPVIPSMELFPVQKQLNSVRLIRLTKICVRQLTGGELDYFDLHLSQLAQEIRYGFLGGINVAIIEASQVTEKGGNCSDNCCGNCPYHMPIGRYCNCRVE